MTAAMWVYLHCDAILYWSGQPDPVSVGKDAAYNNMSGEELAKVHDTLTIQTGKQLSATGEFPPFIFLPFVAGGIEHCNLTINVLGRATTDQILVQ
jgi:hypothetical protein